MLTLRRFTLRSHEDAFAGRTPEDQQQPAGTKTRKLRRGPYSPRTGAGNADRHLLWPCCRSRKAARGRSDIENQEPLASQALSATGEKRGPGRGVFAQRPECVLRARGKILPRTAPHHRKSHSATAVEGHRQYGK